MSIRYGDHGHPGAAAAAPDTLTAADLRAWVGRAERAIVRHRAQLDRLDASLGDGDHGENMSVGFGDAVRSIGPDRRLATRARCCAASGSCSSRASAVQAVPCMARRSWRPACRRRTPGLDATGLAEAFDAAAEGLARRGRCRPGDKTIYDALRPAADAVGAATRDGEDIATALGRAAAAANAGMRSTRPLIARRGLALRLGERSRGHQDPGATSCFLLVRAMLPDARP